MGVRFQMNNLGTLYCYELKKIMKRRITWIAVAIAAVISFLTACADVTGKYYVDGIVYDTHYHMMQTDREYARRLSGRKIDQELLLEMQEAYRKVPAGAERYSLTEEYQTYARPYSAVFQFARKVMEMNTLSEMQDWEVNEEELYRNYQNMAEEERKKQFLTEGEKSFWAEKERAVEKPIVFGYADAYWKLLSSSYTICMVLLLLIAVCLSDSFTKEHTYRTDQLLLCSRLGKRQLYLAKVLAGMSFSLGIALFSIAIMTAASITTYGADGFGVALQYAMCHYSWPLSVGDAVILIYVQMLFAILVTSAFVMMLSELLHSRTAALAIVSGMLIFSIFFNIPAQYRIVAQIWSFFPANFVSTYGSGMFNLWLVRIFGRYLTAWQAAPILYILLSAVFLLVGKRAYQKYQVSGR